MNSILQSQFDRIETVLATLIDSIAAYNPSIAAANNLLTADDELQIGLKQLIQHQRNHARILALHEQISQQNMQITTNLTTLADLRNDLLSTPTSIPPKDARKVPYTELLDYAKHISRYTAPLTARKLPALSKPRPDATPAVNGEVESAKEGDDEGKGIGTEALEDEERKWLEPLMQIPFAPWVSDDVMKRGALAQIQAMVERGEEPSQAKPEGEVEIGEDQKAGERVEEVQDESSVSGNIMGTREGEKRQERRIAKPGVFGGLDLYDPSNPDEEG